MNLKVLSKMPHPNFQKALEKHKKRISNGLTFQWHILNQCNWRCKHCYHETYEGGMPNLEEMKDIFHQYLKLGEKYKIPPKDMRITLTGGEPFLHPHFMEFLEYSSQFHEKFQMAILTNGSLIDEAKMDFIVQKCPAVKNIQISIEGNETINDDIRGKGAFEKILKAVSIIKKYPIPVHLGCTVSKQNFDDIWDLLDLLLIYDIPVILRRLVPIGNSEADLENLVSPKQLKTLYEKIHEINQKYQLKSDQSSGTVFEKNKKIYRTNCIHGLEALTTTDWARSCGARRKNIFVVLPNLDVLPCRLLPQIILGNLKNNSLDEVYESEAYNDLTKLEKLNKECQSCEAVDRCFGGAACIAKAMTGSVWDKDPQCWK